MDNLELIEQLPEQPKDKRYTGDHTAPRDTSIKKLKARAWEIVTALQVLKQYENLEAIPTVFIWQVAKDSGLTKVGCKYAMAALGFDYVKDGSKKIFKKVVDNAKPEPKPDQPVTE